MLTFFYFTLVTNYYIDVNPSETETVKIKKEGRLPVEGQVKDVFYYHII